LLKANNLKFLTAVLLDVDHRFFYVLGIKNIFAAPDHLTGFSTIRDLQSFTEREIFKLFCEIHDAMSAPL